MLHQETKDRPEEAAGATPRELPPSSALAVEREELERAGRNWSARHVADLLGLSELTVKRMACRGRLPAVKVGRSWQFPPDKVRAWYSGEPAGRPHGKHRPGKPGR